MNYRPSNWRTVTLGDVTFEHVERRGSLPQFAGPVYGVDRELGLTPAPKYMASDLSRYKVLPKRFFAYNPMRLNIGSISFCREELSPGYVSPDYVVFGCREDLLLPEFLEYWRKGPEWTAFVEGAGVGSVRERIYYRNLARLSLCIPPVDEQLRIVSVLMAMEDRIALNERMNKTLELIAREIFRSWFFDFDPVRAKVEGREPVGMDSDTAALFPSEFEASDLGPVPKGWRQVAVEELYAGLFDGRHGTPAPSETGAMFLGIRNFTPTGLDFTDIRRISEEDWPEWTRRVTPTAGDIVFTYEATLGFFAVVPPGLRCCLGRRIALVRPKADAENGLFLFHSFISKPFQNLLTARKNHGSTVDRIPLTDFPSYPILWPGLELSRRFSSTVAPLWERIHANQAQMETLRDLRDTLLPRLISGRLRITEAEAVLAEAIP